MSVQQNKFAVAVASLFFSSAAIAETHLYAVLMKSLSNPFWSAAELGTKSGAEAASVDYYLQAVESDDSPEQQLETCTTMLQRRPSVMLAASVNPTNLLPCLQRAQELNIPVVDLGGNLDRDAAKESGIEIAFSIQPDNLAVGTQAADHIANQLNNDSNQVLVLTTASDSKAEQRTEGFTKQLDKIAPDFEIIQTVVKDGSVADIVADTVTSNPELSAIFAVNDTIAIDAVEAAEAAGISDKIIVVGADGTPGAIESIKDGKLNASVASLPYLIGKQGIEQASKILDGNTTEEVILVPTMVLSKELLEQGTDPMLEFVK